MKLCILMIISLIGLTNQGCLPNEKLRALGLTPLTSPQAVSNPPVCAGFYQQNNAKACVDLNLMKENVQGFGDKYADSFADEAYEYIVNLDMDFDSYSNANAEIQADGTYDGKPVSEKVRKLFEEANQWIDENDVDFTNVGAETSACNVQSQRQLYGTYCLLSSDQATLSLSTSTTVSTDTSTSTSGSTTTNTTSSQTASNSTTTAETGGSQDDLDAFNAAMAEAETSSQASARLLTQKFRILNEENNANGTTNITVAVSETSASNLIGNCANNIKNICTYYYINRALKGAEGKNVPANLKNKCNRAFMACTSSVPNDSGTSSSSSGCNSRVKASIMKNFFGGFKNKMIDAETREQFSLKGTGTAITRKALWEKLENFGIGKSMDKSQSMKARKDEKVKERKDKNAEKGKTNVRRLESSTTVTANIVYESSPTGKHVDDYGNSSGFETHASVGLFVINAMYFFIIKMI